MVETEIVDGVCVLRLNAPPQNTITLALLARLRAALDQAAKDAAVKGTVITGHPSHFSAGADINMFERIASRDEARLLCHTFQTALQEIEDCGKPVIAALAGRVIGGAVELATACHYRVAGDRCRFTMPEVTLGINPGAGGTQRLPRLVGPVAALRMLLTAETVDAHRALALGLVDAVCPQRQVVDRARAWVLEAPAIRRTSRLTGKVADPADRAAAYREAEQLVLRTPAEIIAPAKIVGAVRTGLEESYQAGLLAEQLAFEQCIESPAARNKIYLFFATRQTTKIAELAGEKPVVPARAAVIGMGSRGTEIASAIVLSAAPVIVLDRSEDALAKGTQAIRDSICAQVEPGKISASQAERALSLLATTTRWHDIAEADLVIESVGEDFRAKRTVIDRAEQACRPDTMLAVNTSTIRVDELTAGMHHPQRLVGMHFVHPVHRWPLVEVVRHAATPPAILAAAIGWLKKLGKIPVVVASREGLVVTRLCVPYVQEACLLLEEGATAAAIDRAAVTFGFAVGPLLLMDGTGLDILAHSQRVLASALPRQGSLSPIVARLVERGHLGQQTGAGIYRYKPGSQVPLESEPAAEVIAGVQRERGRTAREVLPDEITERLVLRVVSEAFYTLQEGVARSKADINVASVSGMGFPDLRGGVLKYAEELGLNRVRARLDELAGRLGERFLPCQLLTNSEGVS